jgi:hypothetical protein
MQRVHHIGLALALALSAGAAQSAIVQNGSLENLQNTWSNTSCNYMAAGATDITGWTRGAAATGPVAWGRTTTCDGFAASQGSYFVDLSGFGTVAGPASLDQMLQNLIAGETYIVGIDYLGAAPELRINGLAISSSAGGTSGWTGLSASFVATGSQALLSLQNISGSGVVFVDNVTVAGREAGGSVPEPGALSLAAVALAALALGRRGPKG